jgi:uncharacterized protein (DUF3084 family)
VDHRAEDSLVAMTARALQLSDALEAVVERERAAARESAEVAAVNQRLTQRLAAASTRHAAEIQRRDARVCQLQAEVGSVREELRAVTARGQEVEAAWRASVRRSVYGVWCER